MTKEDYYRIRDAVYKDAGMDKFDFDLMMCRVVMKAVAAEREECIALYGNDDVAAPVGNSAWGEAYQEGWTDGTQAYRDAIRARGQE